ncbi:collagen-like protein [bacterium]|nr:collagen-like protein [bacterium]
MNRNTVIIEQTPPNSVVIETTMSLGLQGVQGLQGGFGAQGLQGIIGSQGLQGIIGSQGLQGVQGLQGASLQGIQGIQGVSGIINNNSITYDQLSNSPTISLNAQKRMAKAWVNFNGTGVINIRDSFNISSITDNGVGNYTINFSTPFANTNYCVSVFARDIDDDSYVSNLAAIKAGSSKTINSFMVWCSSIRNGVLYDTTEYNIIVMAG